MNGSTLTGKRIFMTGGTGFFGKSILERIDFSNSELLLLSRDPARFARKNPDFAGLPGVRFLSGDVRDFALPSGEFDFIIHGAAASSSPVPDAEMHSVIVEGTRRVLEFATQCRCRKMLYVSSGAVYGRLSAPALESMLPQPQSAYGKAKLEAENLCLASPVPAVIARCFAFSGRHLPQNAHYALGNFLRDAAVGKKIVIRGDGMAVRSYMHADDLADWLIAILLRGRAGETYNVGSPDSLTVRELAGRVAPGLPCEILNRSGVKPGRDDFYLPDVSKAMNELDLKITRNFLDI